MTFHITCAAVPQRYWIKDIDTGNVYVLDGGAEAGSTAADSGRVTELLSGKELRCWWCWAGLFMTVWAAVKYRGGTAVRWLQCSCAGVQLKRCYDSSLLGSLFPVSIFPYCAARSVNEFEGALGYFREPQPAPQPHFIMAAAADGGKGDGSVGASMQQAAQKSIKGLSSGATWVKASVGGMISNLKASPRSDGGSSPAAADGGIEARGSQAVPALVDDRQGQPVKVQVRGQ
jgi:hypothetical protein